MRFKGISVLGILLLAIFALTPKVLAGGGGVYAAAISQDDPHWNIVRVYFDPKLFTCKGMVTSFSFVNPQEGDLISGLNGDNSSTIDQDASGEMVDGKLYLRCSTYAKVYSKNLEDNRLLNISYKGTNLEGGRTIAVSFGSKGGSLSIMPWEEGSEIAPTDQPAPILSSPVSYFPTSLSLKVTDQSLFEGAKGRMRHVFLQWDGSPGDNVYYRIYERLGEDAPAGSAGWAFNDTLFAGPTGSVDLAADYDWYIRVDACTKTYPNKCIISPSILLSKLSGTPSPEVSLSPIPTVFVDQRIEELNQKMAALQTQLEESKAKQSVLEQTVNELLKFIKSIFPFFKSN